MAWKCVRLCNIYPVNINAKTNITNIYKYYDVVLTYRYSDGRTHLFNADICLNFHATRAGRIVLQAYFD